ncbi:MAG: phosphate ABC transporter substrate-binding/OmpA family protein [Saprospiraceae bacterium]
MARLTTLSKLLITILILLVIFFGFNYFVNGSLLPNLGGDGTEQAGSTDGSGGGGGLFGGGKKSNNDAIRVGVVTWGGYAGGQYFNEGFAASAESRFKKEYGIDVEFVLNDDVVSSLAAFKNGDIDVHWYTIDAFPTILSDLSAYNPVVLFQADWSRGGDAIVAQRGINNVAGLRGKTVAVAELTPSHSFLLWLLDAGGMTVNDIDIIPQASAIDAAAAFKSGQVDAAVVWSPDDEQAVRAVSGARILESTRSASNIIADVFFAKREYVEQNKDKLQKLYEGWMRGAAEINASEANKQKAARILATGLAIPEGDALAAINNVRLVTHGDNVNFFGLNPSFKGVTGESLYQRMANEYSALKYIEGSVPAFRGVSYPQLVNAASGNLSGPENAAEAGKEFAAVKESEAEAKEAIATKQVSINFASGQSTLDENAKRIIDRDFVEIARAFGNARVRIEGNTDNTGGRATNVELSKRRAQAVAGYLVREYSMDPNRFIIVGNGPDNPVADNGSERGRAQNRRTDFELVRE